MHNYTHTVSQLPPLWFNNLANGPMKQQWRGAKNAGVDQLSALTRQEYNSLNNGNFFHLLRVKTLFTDVLNFTGVVILVRKSITNIRYVVPHHGLSRSLQTAQASLMFHKTCEKDLEILCAFTISALNFKVASCT